MKRSRIFILVCVSISILLMIVNWRGVSSFLAQRNLLWFDNVIDRQKTVMFKSAWVDSLYVKKEYSYYVFTDESLDRKAIQELPYDSVLVIKPIDVPLTFVNEELDTLSLPVSVFDLMLKDGERLALFKILSARRDTLGYLYNLKRISITN